MDKHTVDLVVVLGGAPRCLDLACILILSVRTKEKTHKSLIVAPESLSANVASSMFLPVGACLEDMKRAIGLTSAGLFEES